MFKAKDRMLVHNFYSLKYHTYESLKTYRLQFSDLSYTFSFQ